MSKKLFLSLLVAGMFVVAQVDAVAVTKTVTQLPTALPTVEPTPTSIVGPIDNSLEKVVRENRVGKWTGVNSLRLAVEMAMDKGVPANTVVLLLLLPLIATVVSVLHYVIGLSGYGIFMPTMIAVAFLATGVVSGLVLFGTILAISLLSNLVLKRYKLHFWPSRSINLMLISLGTFGLMMVSTYVPILDLNKISIFPMLFMILLSEEFVRTQLAKSKSEAKKLMLGTLILAMLGAGLMSIRSVQMWILLNPGWSMLLGLVVNIVVGNYSGIRLSEIKRFGKAIRKK